MFEILMLTAFITIGLSQLLPNTSEKTPVNKKTLDVIKNNQSTKKTYNKIMSNLRVHKNKTHHPAAFSYRQQKRPHQLTGPFTKSVYKVTF
jgi:hypothetical protein